jgi:hypothetical protein
MHTIYHDGTWSEEELRQMAAGKFVDRNGKRYGICRGCRKVIRIDHPLFGSVHLCAMPE